MAIPLVPSPRCLIHYKYDFLSLACGQLVVGDVSRLEKLGVNMVHLIELGELATKHDPDQPDGTGIQTLAKRYLRQHLPKDLQSGSDWSHSSITNDQIEYVARDALVSRLLAEVLLTNQHQLKELFCPLKRAFKMVLKGFCGILEGVLLQLKFVLLVDLVWLNAGETRLLVVERHLCG